MTDEDYAHVPLKERFVRAAAALLFGVIFFAWAALDEVARPFLMLPAFVGLIASIWLLCKQRKLTPQAEARKRREAKESTEAANRLSAVALGILLCLGGLAVLGWQAFLYLKLGAWEPFSIINFLAAVGEGWAKRPTDWIGAYKILSHLPLSLSLIGFGALFIASGKQ